MSRLGAVSPQASSRSSPPWQRLVVLAAALLFITFAAASYFGYLVYASLAGSPADSPSRTSSAPHPATTSPSSTSTTSSLPSCADGIQNGDEVGVDCGGMCPPCASCSDGLLNQDELAIDCGGVCPPCQSCTDGIQNQGERGVDCGGPCPPCATCVDGIRNGDEEGVDCGGSCPRECTMTEEELGRCLAREGVILYYSTNKVRDRWSPRVLEDLGRAITYIDHVDCADDEDRCDDEDIRGTPLWKVYGDDYPARTVQAIRDLTGCIEP